MKSTKVLFINPPVTIPEKAQKFYTFPMGLGYLAAVTERDFDVQVIDCPAEGYTCEVKLGRDKDRMRFGLTLEELEARIYDRLPHIVGISCMYSDQVEIVHEICKLTKDVADRSGKAILNVLGGAHASFAPELVMQDRNVDFVVIGEGESSFYSLLTALESGAGIEAVEGIAYKNNANRVVINSRRTFIDNLDVIPFPARHLFMTEKYIYCERERLTPYIYPNATMITSRGCRNSCTFCTVPLLNGNNTRFRSVNNVIFEMQHLRDTYNVREIHFEDELFGQDPNYVLELCEAMEKNNLNMTWAVSNSLAIWNLDEMILRKMRRSGCHSICVGLISCNSPALDQLDSPVDPVKSKELLNFAKKLGMEINVYMMLGIPGNTAADEEKVIDFALKLSPERAFFNLVTPYPGTKLLEYCMKEGCFKTDVPAKVMIFSPGYIETPFLKAEEVYRMKRIADFKFTTNKTLKNPSLLFKAAGDFLMNTLKSPFYPVKLIENIMKLFKK